MADLKISAMTPATALMDADILPIIQGGANFSITKTLLLTGGVGEPQLLQAAAGQAVQMGGNDGFSQVIIDAGNSGGISVAGDASITSFTSGTTISAEFSGLALIEVMNGAQFIARDVANVTFILMDTFAAQVNITAANGVFITYVPSNPGNWPTGVPSVINAALDQLASAIFTLSGGTLP